MVYSGRVRGGVVVFDNGSPPEGTAVRVEIVSVSNPVAAETQGTIWAKLRKYSGAVSGLPNDFARNHDHYIHGAPKAE